ncbi:MAG: murein biosynthesis integral membrane protein MurJ [Pseudomonadota bacterium]
MSVLKSLATVSGFTMASRVLGLVRQQLMAGVLGASEGPWADAFNAAFRLPNMFRRLFAEGAFQAAFVPMFSRALEGEGEAAAKRFAEEVLAGLVFVLTLLTAVAELFAPVLVYLLASGFAEDADKFDVAVVYTRIMFPYLMCMSLVGLMGGVLNSLGRFFAAAAAPVLLNVVTIAVLLWPFQDAATSAYALSWAVFAAGLAQLGALYVGCRRSGYRLRLRMPKLTPGVKRLLVLGVPGFIAAGAHQINIIIGTNIASRQQGGVSWLSYADLLYQFPLAIIGIAMGVVLLPTLSRKAKAGDEAGAVDALNRALELSLFFALPAAVALAVIPDLLIEVLFRELPALVLGATAFTELDRARTAAALIAFACGLPAFILVKVFSPAFFAREDTKTPMRFALFSIAINTVMAIGLFFQMGYLGVAVATSFAAWLNAGLLAARLFSLGAFRPDKRLTGRLPRIILAAVAMGGALYALTRHAGFLLDGLQNAQWLLLIITVLFGLVAFGVAGLVFGAARPSDVKAALGKGDPPSS